MVYLLILIPSSMVVILYALVLPCLSHLKPIKIMNIFTHQISLLTILHLPHFFLLGCFFITFSNGSFTKSLLVVYLVLAFLKVFIYFTFFSWLIVGGGVTGFYSDNYFLYCVLTSLVKKKSLVSSNVISLYGGNYLFS